MYKILRNGAFKQSIVRPIYDHLKNLVGKFEEFDIFSESTEDSITPFSDSSHQEFEMPTAQNLVVQELINRKSTILKNYSSLNEYILLKRKEVEQEAKQLKEAPCIVVGTNHPWRDMLQGVIDVAELQIQNMKCSSSGEQVKCQKFGNFDILEHKIKVKISIPALKAKIDELDSSNNDSKSVQDFNQVLPPKAPAKKSSTSKYGQMSLRGKRSQEKEIAAFQSQKNFDSTLQKILASVIDEEHYKYIIQELQLLFSTKSIEETADSTTACFSDHVDFMKYHSDRLFSNEVSSSTSDGLGVGGMGSQIKQDAHTTNSMGGSTNNKQQDKEVNILRNLPDSRVSILEIESLLNLFEELEEDASPPKTAIGMQQETSEDLQFWFLDLLRVVVSHLLSCSFHHIQYSAYTFDVKNYYGPSPLLQIKQLKIKDMVVKVYKKIVRFIDNFFEFDQLVSLTEIMGEELIKIEESHANAVRRAQPKSKILKIQKSKESATGRFKTLLKEAHTQVRTTPTPLKPRKMKETSIIMSPVSDPPQNSFELKKAFCLLRIQIQSVGFCTLVSLPDLSIERKRARLRGIISKMKKTIVQQYCEFQKHQELLVGSSDNFDGDLNNASFAEDGDNELDFYWLKIGKMSINAYLRHAAENVVNKISSSSDFNEASRVQSIIETLRKKKQYRDYLSYNDMLSEHYLSYFQKTPISISRVPEYFGAFTKIVQVFVDSFQWKNRPTNEDVRDTFLSFLESSKIPRILGYFSKNVERPLVAEGLQLLDESVAYCLIVNLFKILLFTLYLYKDQKELILKITEFIFKVGPQILSKLIYFRICRSIHFLLFFSDRHYHFQPGQVYSSETKTAVLRNGYSLIKDHCDDISLPAIECELLSLVKLFYGIGTDGIKYEDYLSPEKLRPTDNMPYYKIQNQKQPDYDVLNLQVLECVPLLSILHHFFFSKHDSDFGVVVFARILQNQRSKVSTGSYINRQNVFSINLPQKFRRGLFKIFERLFVMISKDEKKYMGCRSLSKMIHYPQILNYYSVYLKVLEAGELKVIDVDVTHENFTKYIGGSMEGEVEGDEQFKSHFGDFKIKREEIENLGDKLVRYEDAEDAQMVQEGISGGVSGTANLGGQQQQQQQPKTADTVGGQVPQEEVQEEEDDEEETLNEFNASDYEKMVVADNDIQEQLSQNQNLGLGQQSDQTSLKPIATDLEMVQEGGQTYQGDKNTINQYQVCSAKEEFETCLKLKIPDHLLVGLESPDLLFEYLKNVLTSYSGKSIDPVPIVLQLKYLNSGGSIIEKSRLSRMLERLKRRKEQDSKCYCSKYCRKSKFTKRMTNSLFSIWNEIAAREFSQVCSPEYWNAVQKNPETLISRLKIKVKISKNAYLLNLTESSPIQFMANFVIYSRFQIEQIIGYFTLSTQKLFKIMNMEQLNRWKILKSRDISLLEEFQFYKEYTTRLQKEEAERSGGTSIQTNFSLNLEQQLEYSKRVLFEHGAFQGSDERHNLGMISQLFKSELVENELILIYTRIEQLENQKYGFNMLYCSYQDLEERYREFGVAIAQIGALFGYEATEEDEREEPVFPEGEGSGEKGTMVMEDSQDDSEPQDGQLMEKEDSTDNSDGLDIKEVKEGQEEVSKIVKNDIGGNLEEMEEEIPQKEKITVLPSENPVKQSQTPTKMTLSNINIDTDTPQYLKILSKNPNSGPIQKETSFLRKQKESL